MEQCVGHTPSQAVISELMEAPPTSPKNNKEKFKTLMSNINQKVIKTLDKLKPPTISTTSSTSPAISRSNSTEKRRVAIPGRPAIATPSNLQETHPIDMDGKAEDNFFHSIAFNASVVVALLAILWISWNG